jgi:DNA helicase II / ATP-dependent DNA helicase PcrA
MKDGGALVDGDGAFELPATLTEPQRAAVLAQDAALCVLASAGGGKTRVLTLRVARRVHDGSAAARHVLVCTFSRKAADELRHRLWQLGVEGVRAATIHGTAMAILVRHNADAGKAPPTVLADRRAVLTELLSAEKGAGRTGRSRGPSVATLDTEIGWAKATMVAPADYEAAAAERGRATSSTPAVAELYARYEAFRGRQGSMDIDDLLTRCAELLERDAERCNAVRWQFRHVFVDEMQDVNPSQFRLLQVLSGPSPDLFVVGDPNQSVYGWNGADPTLLERLPVLVPGMRVLRLDANHRSSPQVVGLAAAALGATGALSSSRFDGPIPRIVEHATDAQEAEWIAQELVLAHRGTRRWSQLAVLTRTNAQLEPIAAALAARGIPSVIAGSDLAPASDVRTPGPATSGEGTARVPRAPEHPDAVVLSTFHRAKGLQWTTVFVAGLADGFVPLASARRGDAREEERRLLYVALTRAEDELTCTWSRSADDAGGEREPRRPSPWLSAMLAARDAMASDAEPLAPDALRARFASLRSQLDRQLPLPLPLPDD